MDAVIPLTFWPPIDKIWNQVKRNQVMYEIGKNVVAEKYSEIKIVCFCEIFTNYWFNYFWMNAFNFVHIFYPWFRPENLHTFFYFQPNLSYFTLISSLFSAFLSIFSVFDKRSFSCLLIDKIWNQAEKNVWTTGKKLLLGKRRRRRKITAVCFCWIFTNYWCLRF